MNNTAETAVVKTLTALPAAVTNTKASPKMSDRYVHVNTHDIVKMMEAEGFRVASVQVTAARHRDPLYARHMVDLRRTDLEDAGGYSPRFLLTNSHDGSSSASIMMGAYRFVCSNGLVVGSTYAAERVRHSGEIAKALLERVGALAKNTAPLFEQITAWQAKEMTEAQARQFARLASVLRWGDPHRYDVTEMLKVRREEDDNRALWTVFNRVQENSVRGGLVGMSRSGRQATSRPLSEIVSSNQFNAQLWKLAEEFAAL
jgi:hypothetical protein